MIVGVHTSNYSTLNTFCNGHLKVGRVFPNGFPWPTTETPSAAVSAEKMAAAPVIAAGMLPLWEIKAAPLDILSGKMDALIKAVFAWAPPGSDGCWYHEGDAASHNNNATDFMNAYKHIWNLKPAGATFGFGPVYNAYTWRLTPLSTAWLPPVGHYDWLGIDAYSSDANFPTQSLKTHPGFQNWLKTIPATAKVYVTERGISTGQNLTPPRATTFQSDLIKADFAYLRSLPTGRVKGYLYWDGGGASTTSVFFLNSTSKATLKELAALEDSPAPVPVPVPIPPADPNAPKLTTSGKPYYTWDQPIATTMDAVCGICWSLILQSGVDQHMSSLHP